jgi:hypothetical protein
MTSASNPSGAPAKIEYLFIDLGAEAFGRLAALADPVIEVLVRNAEKCLELVEFGVVHLADPFVGEGTQDQVDFLEAPVPSLEYEPLSAVFGICIHGRCISILLRSG